MSCIISLIFSWMMHDFHFSTTDINCKPEENLLEITIHVFIDDLEKGLSNSNGTAVIISNKNPCDSLISVYVNDHIKLKDGLKFFNLNYLGGEVSTSMDAYWMYFELRTGKDLKFTEIQNTILIDEYSDQRNLVNISVNGKKEKSTLLSKSESTLKFKFP
ncbi:MAG: hypothetical protein KDC16_04160 [Saprospiraceae bacterium]|nr:hypothetical protein [Saprospiraceae bacterium]